MAHDAHDSKENRDVSTSPHSISVQINPRAHLVAIHNLANTEKIKIPVFAGGKLTDSDIKLRVTFIQSKSPVSF